MTDDRPARGLRVLVLTHVFPRDERDSAAPFLLRHLQGLQAAGVEVRVVAPHDAGLPLEHTVGGVPVRRVRYGPDARETLAYRGEMHQLVRSPAGALRALRLVVGAGPCHPRGARTLAPRRARRPLARPRRRGRPPRGVPRRSSRACPSRSTCTGPTWRSSPAAACAAAAGRYALGVADRVAAMSVPLAGDLERALGRPADSVLPMPAAPPPPPTPRPVDGPVLAVGRLVAEKGHADLLDAVARLRSNGRTGLRLTIVGEGPERDRLAAHAGRIGVDLDPPGCARARRCSSGTTRGASLVVVPSRREGFGLVAAEALARHRPVVATAAGGLVEIVDDTTGWSVPPGDVGALAAAIATALDDPAEADRRTRAGADRVAETVGRRRARPRRRRRARPDGACARPRAT